MERQTPLSHLKCELTIVLKSINGSGRMSATGSGNSQPAKSETIVHTGENISEFDLLWLPCGTARIRLYTRGIGARASIEKPALRNSVENNTFNQQLEMAEHRLKE